MFKMITFPIKVKRPAGTVTELHKIADIGNPDWNEGRSGRCYELARGFAIANRAWTLVHATLHLQYDIPIGRGGHPNRSFPHAFCERNGTVYDPVLDIFYDKQSFYECYKITDVKKYSWKEGMQNATKYNITGPWPV